MSTFGSSDTQRLAVEIVRLHKLDKGRWLRPKLNTCIPLVMLGFIGCKESRSKTAFVEHTSLARDTDSEHHKSYAFLQFLFHRDSWVT
jgi:hypothetical protein